MLFRDTTSLENSGFNKECVKSRLQGSPYISFKQVSKIFEKDFSIEKSIQTADKANNIVILNRSDYISKLSKILDDTSKFKRVNIDEGKALNHLIHMEEQIMRLLKSLEDEGEISEKEKKSFIFIRFYRSSTWVL